MYQPVEGEVVYPALPGLLSSVLRGLLNAIFHRGSAIAEFHKER